MWNARSGLRRDLHVDSIRVLDVQTGQVALQGSRAALGQIARDRFPREAGNPDREVINSAGRASDIERYQRLGVAEPNNFYSALFGLADHSKTEHFLIEVDGLLQITDLNADMVDVCGFEVDVFLRGCRGSARGEHREALDQFSTGE